MLTRNGVSPCGRVGELFDVLVEFPDSEAALIDLRTCLAKVDLRAHLICSLKSTSVAPSCCAVCLRLHVLAVGFSSACYIPEPTQRIS